MDLSCNELTLQFIGHSRFNCEGTYALLSQKIERVTEQYYLEILTLPLEQVKRIMQFDTVLISRIFLACTFERINKMSVETLMQSYQGHYFGLYKDYGIYYNDELPTDPIMYTAFGKLLFSNDQTHNAIKKIKNFIEQMKVKGKIRDIIEYNELVFCN